MKTDYDIKLESHLIFLMNTSETDFYCDMTCVSNGNSYLSNKLLVHSMYSIPIVLLEYADCIIWDWTITEPTDKVTNVGSIQVDKVAEVAGYESLTNEVNNTEIVFLFVI